MKAKIKMNLGELDIDELAKFILSDIVLKQGVDLQTVGKLALVRMTIVTTLLRLGISWDI